MAALIHDDFRLEGAGLDGVSKAEFLGAMKAQMNAFTAFFMLAIDLALQGEAIHMHLLSTRLYDVAVGCALALLGTIVATKWAGKGDIALPAKTAPGETT